MTNNTRLKSVFIRLFLIIIAASLSLIYNIIVESKISIKDYEHLAKTPNDNEYEFYKWIHLEQYPASAAGKWTMRPMSTLSPDHLSCLDLERQGNCHNEDAWRNSTDKARLTRHDSLLKGAIQNSPGILNASDPWA